MTLLLDFVGDPIVAPTDPTAPIEPLLVEPIPTGPTCLDREAAIRLQVMGLRDRKGYVTVGKIKNLIIALDAFAAAGCIRSTP